MKSLVSFFLIGYVVFLVCMPVHAEHDCDHVEHTEQHASEHAENQCCPPFSFCKVCSVFIYQVRFQFEAIEPDRIISNEFVLEMPVFQETCFSIWQPPQLI